MKLKTIAPGFLGTVLLVLLSAGLALAGNSSRQYGEQLFNDSTLGGSANEQSCNSCHSDGQGLEQAEKTKLTKNINQCLTNAMQGEKLDGRSAKIRSIKMYVMSLHKQ